MKIVAIYGSPNKKGNSATITDSILKGAEKSGHEIERIHLYDLNFKGCTACENADKIHQERICIHEDDMKKQVIPKMIDTDLLLISSPVYMGHITGITKTFFDRWHTFIKQDFTIRHLNGKKFVTIVTSGAPTEQFEKVSEYLDYWLSNFFKMEKAGQLHEGDLMGKGAIEKKPEILKKAEEFGESL